MLVLAGLFARNNDLIVSFESNKNKDLKPNIYIPINWQSNFYSSIAYKESQEKTLNKIERLKESKNLFDMQSKSLQIGWIYYKKNDFSVGITSTFLNTTNSESGYAYDAQNILGLGANYLMVFENNIELNEQKTSIYTSYEYKKNDFLARIFSSFSVYRQLNLSQNTMLKPPNLNAKQSSNDLQKTSIDLGLEGYYLGISWLKLGVEALFSHLPFTYDLFLLEHPGPKFVLNSIQETQQTYQYLAKFIIKTSFFNGFYPSFGIGQKFSRNTYNKLDTKNSSQSILSFGLESVF